MVYKIHCRPESCVAGVRVTVRVRKLKLAVIHESNHLGPTNPLVILIDPCPGFRTRRLVVGVQAIIWEDRECLFQVWETKDASRRGGRVDATGNVSLELWDSPLEERILLQSRVSKLVQLDLYFSEYIPCCFAQLREAFHDPLISKRFQSTDIPCGPGGVWHCFRDRRTDASSMTTAIAAKCGSSKEEAIAFTDGKTTEQKPQNLFFI